MKNKKDIKKLVAHYDKAINGLDFALATGPFLDFYSDSRIFNELEAARNALLWVLDKK